MKITMYELLGMVKDGKAPKLIKYKDYIYSWDSDYQDYVCDDLFLLDFTSISEDLQEYLQCTLEILEEKEIKPLTKKDIEALGYACGEIQKCFTNGWTKSLENKPLEEEKKIPDRLGIDDINTIDLFVKINEIIDYLKSKGDE